MRLALLETAFRIYKTSKKNPHKFSRQTFDEVPEPIQSHSNFISKQKSRKNKILNQTQPLRQIVSGLLVPEKLLFLRMVNICDDSLHKLQRIIRMPSEFFSISLQSKKGTGIGLFCYMHQCSHNQVINNHRPWNPAIFPGIQRKRMQLNKQKFVY